MKPAVKRLKCQLCREVGHESGACPCTRFPCKMCGAVHGTKRCTYDKKAKVLHELWDDMSFQPFFMDELTGETTWEFPRETDKVLWHCEPCRVLLPSKMNSCRLCGFQRPRLAPVGTPLNELACMSGQDLRESKLEDNAGGKHRRAGSTAMDARSEASVADSEDVIG